MWHFSEVFTIKGDLMLHILVIAIVLVLLAVILIRTARFTSRQIEVEPAPDIPLNGEEAARHLSGALQFKTISYQDPAQFDKETFQNLHKYLEKTFPEAHATLEKEVVSDYSLLYTWKGTNEQLNPILLMAHLDVVPVEKGTEPQWTYPPFEGAIKEGYIWGRGSMDIKEGVLGILEAVETLLKDGFNPDKTIYLAFGHDEEVGGRNGASNIAALLKSRGVSLEYVLDEGGSITKGVVPGVSVPVALVGAAEKGYISLELTVKAKGGHSSIPPKDTALGILSAAIYRLEENRPPGRLQKTVRQLFEYVGPEMSFARKLVFANLWLFGALVKRQLAQSPETDALIRTTTAPTIVEGGTKENVLPRKVRAVVNFRILPGDTTENVINRAREIINDPRVEIAILEQKWEPSRISDTTSESFITLQKTVRQIFPGTVVAPYLVTGATDSRYYAVLTDNVFKFVPLMVTPRDLSRAHGIDERIGVEDFRKCITFFIQLICNSM